MGRDPVYTMGFKEWLFGKKNDTRKDIQNKPARHQFLK